MKQSLLITISLLLFAGILSGQEKAKETPSTTSGKGTVHSITIPPVRVDLKEGEGRTKTESYCGICHSLDYITMQPKFPKSQWTATVNKMIKVFGAPIPQEEADRIIQYLAVAYGTGN